MTDDRGFSSSGHDPMAAARLILDLRQQGVTDPDILSTMERVSRADFLPSALRGDAWADVKLPIACGQTITRPSVAARMLSALRPVRDGSVLEIGTGSGYTAALLSRLFKRVYSVERYRSLAARARAALADQKTETVEIIVADGHKGWSAAAPYDRIISYVGFPDQPDELLEQLKPEGVLVTPIGTGDKQRLVQYSVDFNGEWAPKVIGASFVLMAETGVAREL